MRKLLTGILHTAAPNERVLPWATKNNKPLDKHGCSTRVTKIEWLCQFIPNEAYRASVRTELNSALALIELVDTAQHVDEFPRSPRKPLPVFKQDRLQQLPMARESIRQGQNRSVQRSTQCDRCSHRTWRLHARRLVRSDIDAFSPRDNPYGPRPSSRSLLWVFHSCLAALGSIFFTPRITHSNTRR